MNVLRLHLSISVLLGLLFMACEKSPNTEYPVLFVENISEVTDNGVLINAKLITGNNSEILEYGFVWSLQPEPTIVNADKYVLQEELTTDVFSKSINTLMQKGETYYVRAYIKNQQFLIYSNEVAFVSQGSKAPEISDFYPKTGNIGDTITITGDNFSYHYSKNVVSINNQLAKVIYARQDTIKAIVPNTINQQSGQVDVTIFGQKILADGTFELITPVVKDFNTKQATFGQTIVIDGERFLSNPESVKVFFGEHVAEIKSVSDKQIEAIVPDALNLRECLIAVQMNNIKAYTNEPFNLTPLKLTSFSPQVIYTGHSITLVGQGFSPVMQNNIVKIGGIKAEVTEASISHLNVKIPIQDKVIYPSREVNITVVVIDDLKSYTDAATINDQWFRLNNYPGNNTSGDNFFASNGKVYIGLNNTNELWCFDPASKTWSKETPFQGKAREGGTGFCFDGNIYFGTGLIDHRMNLTDFWKYDINLKTWEQLKDVPFEARYGSTGYAVNNLGYLSGGVRYSFASYPHPYEDTWKYHPANDTWQEISSFGELEWGGVDGFAHAGALVINNLVYFGLGWNNIATPGGSSERMFIFRPSDNNTWEQIRSFPQERNSRPLYFSLNNSAYFSVGNGFYKYTNFNSWEPIATHILSDYRNGVAFSIGDKAYVGLGQTSAFWEYDPSR